MGAHLPLYMLMPKIRWKVSCFSCNTCALNMPWNYIRKKELKKQTGHEIKGKVKSEMGAVWCQPTTSDNQVKQENCEEVERQSPLYHYHHSSLRLPSHISCEQAYAKYNARQKVSIINYNDLPWSNLPNSVYRCLLVHLPYLIGPLHAPLDCFLR